MYYIYVYDYESSVALRIIGSFLVSAAGIDDTHHPHLAFCRRSKSGSSVLLSSSSWMTNLVVSFGLLSCGFPRSQAGTDDP